MPPTTTMPMRARQREQSRWRPYGPPTSLTQVPNGIHNPSPCSEKPFVRHTHKSQAFRPLQYKNNIRPSNARSSLTPPRTTDYACSTIQLPSESSRRSLRFPTPVSLREEVSEDAYTIPHVPPTDNEDLPPLPELRTEKPMLACANAPFAKETVGM